ncbi:protein p21, partial [Quercus suber]
LGSSRARWWQRLNPGESRPLDVNAGTTGARIWARTGCNFDGSGRGKCQTGDCGGLLQCQAYGAPPNTLAEFALNHYQNLDFFYISLVDGFNVPTVFAKLSDDVVLNIFSSSKMTHETGLELLVFPLSTKFSSLIRTVCWRNKCTTTIPSVVSDLLSSSTAVSPPGGWAAFTNSPCAALASSTPVSSSKTPISASNTSAKSSEEKSTRNVTQSDAGKDKQIPLCTDDDQACKFFKWLDSSICCTRGAAITPIVIAKFNRLEHVVGVTNEELKQAHALIVAGLERERVTKRKFEKAKAACMISKEKANKLTISLVVLGAMFLVLLILSTRFGEVKIRQMCLP